MNDKRPFRSAIKAGDWLCLCGRHHPAGMSHGQWVAHRREQLEADEKRADNKWRPSDDE